MPITPTQHFGPPTERSVAPPAGDSGDPRVTVELGVRSLAADCQPLLDRTVRSLEDAITRGAVDDYEVTILGSSFDPTSSAASTSAGRSIEELVTSVREWAVREGASLGPYFTHEEVERPLLDDRYARVQFPTLCLAEFHDDELAFVAPCRVDGRMVGVLDRVEELLVDTVETTAPPIPE